MKRHVLPVIQAVANPLAARALDHTLGHVLDKGASVAKMSVFAAANCVRHAAQALAGRVHADPSEEERSLLRPFGV